MRAKRYNTETYEKKLATVMTRLGIEKYNYDYTRRAGLPLPIKGRTTVSSTAWRTLPLTVSP